MTVILMALVNLSVSQNKTKKHEHERQIDRQTGRDIQGDFLGRRDVHKSSKELGALEVVNIHGIHVI